MIGQQESVLLLVNDKVRLLQTISLSYHFVLKNTGKKSLGGMEKINDDTFEADDGVKVYIEPNETLKSVSERSDGTWAIFMMKKK